jgi:hypothetical protein
VSFTGALRPTGRIQIDVSGIQVDVGVDDHATLLINPGARHKPAVTVIAHANRGFTLNFAPSFPPLNASTVS